MSKLIFCLQVLWFVAAIFIAFSGIAWLQLLAVFVSLIGVLVSKKLINKWSG